ncbi:hypothetical protein [Thalassobaculum litoreum]|uniref:Uncharacterized protein n=1 Tax=Thalassobaculum litoreum DSM 18839 TaxID=1123362 RepID=A0A8G2BMW6_9PROT|nr:hypothetical protein [Thalassobaculum litoreum]SDG61237.1 hypothetical protein SAMN05660686_05016 [Thalassobaculum litoreum DSM 18839]SDG61578.1 hypothetical protein SAMN05660686_05028 [Thalassobaculum litoreum DSM 18839]
MGDYESRMESDRRRAVQRKTEDDLAEMVNKPLPDGVSVEVCRRATQVGMDAAWIRVSQDGEPIQGLSGLGSREARGLAAALIMAADSVDAVRSIEAN